MIALFQNAVLTIVPFLVIITLIITVHELGHFLTARVFGVAIERFSIGFGRALFSWRDRGGVEWRISWALLGGYVKFAGDTNAASVPDKQDLAKMRAEIVAEEGPGAERKYLPFKPLWQRALIVAAGPAANFLLAIMLFSLIFATLGHLETPFSVASVAPSSAASRAGFQPGDRILAADGHSLPGFEELRIYVAPRSGVPIDFEITRGDQTLHLMATPSASVEQTGFGEPQLHGLLGVSPKAIGRWRYVRLDPLTALGQGARQTWDVLATTAFYLTRLATGKVSFDQLHGFVGVARVSGAITKAAIAEAPKKLGDQLLGVVVNLTGLAALISVSIGFMNLLPVPVLDGGHLLFYAYEWIARRPVGTRVQAAGYRVGLVLLAGLMLFANLHDLPIERMLHFLGSLFS